MNGIFLCSYNIKHILLILILSSLVQPSFFFFILPLMFARYSIFDAFQQRKRWTFCKRVLADTTPIKREIIWRVQEWTTWLHKASLSPFWTFSTVWTRNTFLSPWTPQETQLTGRRRDVMWPEQTKINNPTKSPYKYTHQISPFGFWLLHPFVFIYFEFLWHIRWDCSSPLKKQSPSCHVHSWNSLLKHFHFVLSAIWLTVIWQN